MDGKTFLRALKRLIIAIIKNDFYGMAAEMGFMMVLGIFPFMLLLMSFFGWLGNKSSIGPVLRFLATFMPEQAMNLIITVLSEVMLFSKGGLMALTGICVTLFLSTNIMAVILKGLNRAYDVEETRSFIYTRILAFVMLIVNVLVLFLSINLIIFGKLFIHLCVTYFGMAQHVAMWLLLLRWPVAFAALFVMAFLGYYILPDLKGNERFKMKSALWGTIFFCCFWLTGSWGFSIYVNNLRTYNIVYGTIGAFAVLMMWFYYTSILILIGAEINSQVYNKLNRKAREIQKDLDLLKET
ncbi:MAG: YihY/virulence factor BrkB family protein [Clostridiaceae bacterium]|jgi:membrane protein|nr:YihY/virulence factor BrkB family protein [Clostridiaceae bacterium]